MPKSGRRDPNLIHRDEEKEVQARMNLYRNYENFEDPIKAKRRIFAERMAKWGIPTVFFIFCLIYFSVGAYNYNI